MSRNIKRVIVWTVSYLGLVALFGRHVSIDWVLALILIFTAIGLTGIVELFYVGTKRTLRLLGEYREEWRRFKQEVEARYGPRPTWLREGQEFVEPHFSLRRVKLSNGSVWSGSYCIRKRVVGFVDMTGWHGASNKPMPQFEVVETFLLPEIGHATKVPYLRAI